MGQKKKGKAISSIHPRNKHTGRYDFAALIACEPALAPLVRPNLHGDDSIDFADPLGVKTLNKALLKLHYKIDYWEIPENYLCPPIPGRADYIHHMADWLCTHNFGKIPTGPKITCLDIGVGSSLIYPIIGTTEYNWKFVGTDIDPVSIGASQAIIDKNPNLEQKVELRTQENPKDILYGAINKDEHYDLAICNPPFHNSAAEAQTGSNRKVKNLTGKKQTDATLNFAGQPIELWCDGGESKFIAKYITESKKFGSSCFWFSSLVAKQTHLNAIYKALENAQATQIHTIPMGQGNKTSRIVTWTFLTKAQQQNWKETRWGAAKKIVTD